MTFVQDLQFVTVLNNSTVETRWRGNPGVTVRLEVRGQGLLCCTLRFCFHLPGSLGESSLFPAVTYLTSSLADERRRAALFPQLLHVVSFVPSLLGLHSGANRGSLSFFLILSLFLSHQMENEYKFRPNGRNSPLLLGCQMYVWVSLC